MATNPFEDADGTFSVLVNSEGQHSLWPSFAEVPAGWEPTLTDATRQECLAHVDATWTDMRPASLR
ncbi:MbtH family protein [Streptomyces sp. NBC_01450]|uniref:MbtH family protein n=1 Tax=Streptomyces sp. NBC_01450 TaxID=2903871 RepID=UPI002E376E34|nr:MbtH family protein [Streptomyces sp. NBC_01450]